MKKTLSPRERELIKELLPMIKKLSGLDLAILYGYASAMADGAVKHEA